VAIGFTLGAGALLTTQAPSSAVAETPHTIVEQPRGVHVLAANESVTEGVVQVAFSIRPSDTQDEHRAHGHQTDQTWAEVQFTLTDPTTGQAVVPQAPPMAWLDLQPSSGAQPRDALTCSDKVRLYSQGNIGSRPAVDLNSYYILTLNKDASISVIDPLVGITGMTQLYALVSLKSPGEDWVLSDDQRMLFVSMPQMGEVAVVDAVSFTVLKYIDVGPNPTRLTLQPGGKYLWVVNDSPDARTSGVTVVDTRDLRPIAQFATGAGPHRILMTGRRGGEGHAHGSGAADVPSAPTYALVTNRGNSATVSVIDAQSLARIKDIRLNAPASDFDVSTESNAIYIASDALASISVVDAATFDITNEIRASYGVDTLRLSPDGRWGFAVASRSGSLMVFDTTTNQVVHTSEVPKGADSLSFTNAYAYVHAAASADVALVDMTHIGDADTLPIVRLTAGQRPPAAAAGTSAGQLVLPIHGTHTLIANPSDDYIYYYMEGMNAPMGGFQTYGHTPRALQVADRSLHELTPGLYSTTVQLPQPGEYEAAFLLDAPRVVNCFAFRTEESDAQSAAADQRSPLGLQVVTDTRKAAVGQVLPFRFRLTDRTGEPVSWVQDVQLVATLSSGLRSERFDALAMGDGTYTADLALRDAGIYQVRVAIPSRGTGLGDLPPTTVSITADGN
jgi:DNA-binding beta-propeller fold protein YncE